MFPPFTVLPFRRWTVPSLTTFTSNYPPSCSVIHPLLQTPSKSTTPVSVPSVTSVLDPLLNRCRWNWKKFLFTSNLKTLQTPNPFSNPHLPRFLSQPMYTVSEVTVFVYRPYSKGSGPRLKEDRREECVWRIGPYLSVSIVWRTQLQWGTYLATLPLPVNISRITHNS